MKINTSKLLICFFPALLKRRLYPKFLEIAMSAKTQKLIEDVDELEYNIAFPVNGGIEGIKEPVVYLLGWTGATDKLLAKYSSVYENEGFITLRFISPANVPYSPARDDILKDTSQKLLQLLDDYDLRKHPVFFHVFSNGGALLYRYTTEVFQNDNVDVIGVTMDSGPSRLEVLGGLRAIYYSQRPKGLLYASVLCIGFLSHVLTQLILMRREESTKFYQDLKDSTLSLYPHLFLYSTNDSVVPSEHIEEFAESRRKAGVAVKTINFTDSPHVQHMRFYERRYTELSIKFLDGCLRIYDGTQDATDPFDFSSPVDPAEYI